MRSKFSIDDRKLGDAEELYYVMEPQDLNDHNNEDKRVTLNFVPYVIHRHNPEFKKCTAEIRMPEGSLLKEDVQNWVRLYLNFVDVCKLRMWPTNLDKVGLKETLQILGLRGTDQTFFLLGKDLYEARKWLLKRIITNTSDVLFYREATALLNEMTQPIETHPQRPRKFAVNETIGAI